MKKLGTLLLLTACATNPQKDEVKPAPLEATRVTIIGTDTVKIKSPSVADLTEEDWKQVNTQCVTHLYECQYDDQGQVTQLKALDLSRSEFQRFTEEALRAWKFEPGKSGSCHAQTIYEKGELTRVLVVPQDMAQRMVDTLQQNRAAAPQPDPAKPYPTALRQPKPDVPREMLLKSQSGYIVFDFDIDPEGVPYNIKVVDEQPEGALEKTALQTLKKFRYAKLADEPNSLRHIQSSLYFAVDGVAVSPCDTGLKLNRLARANQENTTGPRQATKPSLK